MNESLNKLLSASLNGYIDDPNEAERIASDLLSLTTVEIDPHEESCILQNLGIYLEMLEQTEIDKESVTCGEFIGILDSFTNEPDADNKEERLLVIKRTLYNLLGALRDNSGKNDAIKLFKAVTVESLFEGMSRKAGKHGFEVFDLYRKLRYLCDVGADYNLNNKTTVSDFFDIAVRQLNKRWDILSPIEEYKKMILTVYEAIYCFFVENIKIGFPEYFNKIEFVEHKEDDEIDEASNASDNAN